ncbi:MAG: hypothetical protein FH758_10760 [Firmicutes bacterium]|nr:hypothetical protein [Bacillota bacterium]
MTYLQNKKFIRPNKYSQVSQSLTVCSATLPFLYSNIATRPASVIGKNLFGLKPTVVEIELAKIRATLSNDNSLVTYFSVNFAQNRENIHPLFIISEHTKKDKKKGQQKKA